MKRKARWTLKDKIKRELKLRDENTGYSRTTSELNKMKIKKRLDELRSRFESLK